MLNKTWKDPRVQKSYDRTAPIVERYFGGSGSTHLVRMTEDFLRDVDAPMNTGVVLTFHKYVSDEKIISKAVRAANYVHTYPTNFFRSLYSAIEGAVCDEKNHWDVYDLLEDTPFNGGSIQDEMIDAITEASNYSALYAATVVEKADRAALKASLDFIDSCYGN